MKVKQSNLIAIKKLSQHNSFFHGFSKENLKNSLGHLTTCHYRKNKIIFMENNLCDSVYYIVDGWIKICTHNMKGKELTLNIVRKGEIIGEISTLEKIPHSTDAITLTESTIIAIPLSNFLAFLRTDTVAIIRLAQLMSKRLREANQWLQLRDAESSLRVVGVLLFLAENMGEIHPKKTYIPHFSLRELASITGLTQETISRVLSKLKQSGLIFRGTDKEKMYIPNLNSLKELTNYN
jgi:CRP-like cAMP-binding protein